MSRIYSRPTLITLITIATALAAGCAVTRVQHSLALARASEPFETNPQTINRHILVIGDSTAVGTGASSPQTSVAGLIARDHPNWKITNRARDGDSFAQFGAQLSRNDRFDVILLLGGGNDVIKFTRRKVLDAAIQQTFARAHALAPVVVCMPAGNVGNAPFFLPPWSWLMTRRSKVLHKLIRDAAVTAGTLYVNLYQDTAVDPFVRHATKYNAADGLHPNDQGYALWYAQLRTQAGRVF